MTTSELESKRTGGTVYGIVPMRPFKRPTVRLNGKLTEDNCEHFIDIMNSHVNIEPRGPVDYELSGAARVLYVFTSNNGRHDILETRTVVIAVKITYYVNGIRFNYLTVDLSNFLLQRERRMNFIHKSSPDVFSINVQTYLLKHIFSRKRVLSVC